METLIFQLKEQIKKLPRNIATTLSDDILNKLYSVYPFNRFEYVISHLIAEKVITLKDYLEIRNNYIIGEFKCTVFPIQMYKKV